MFSRNFDSPIEEVAKAWRSDPVTTETWQIKPERGTFSSADKPFWVTNGQLMGVAKPGCLTDRTKALPIAAQEKIASDLAFDLGLPVPPVVLWNREDVKDKENPLVAISAVPFAQPRTWGEVQNDATVFEILKQDLAQAVSCMSAFDTWVQNVDHHNHAGNLLLGMQAGIANIAYIDYGHSMAHVWKKGGANNEYCAPPYVPKLDVNTQILRKTIEIIESMPEATICNIVARIPLDYISAGDKQLIMNGLLRRQKQLKNVLKKVYPGV